MKYTQKSFTVPASAGTAAYCAEHGHTMPDVRGKCVRCGAPTNTDEYYETLTKVAIRDAASMLCHDYSPEPT